jgi:hypothetical protein
MEILTVALLVVIALVLFGILTALKSGFNEVIRGLQALESNRS